MATKNPPAGRREVHHRALLAALFVLIVLLGFVHACGTEDLIFPGDFPATPTSGNTATPEPTESDDGEF